MKGILIVKPELLALWLERCYKVVIEQKVSEYNKNNISNLVNYIREEAKKNIFDEESLIKEFNKNGIYLAIEDDLPGSKIRGAFKVLNDKPAIYIKQKSIKDLLIYILHYYMNLHIVKVILIEQKMVV